MTDVRIIDAIGNGIDFEMTVVPRIGDLIIREYGFRGQPIAPHYFRVKDVVHRLDNPPNHQVGILVEEEHHPTIWPE
jgi:hypothetical protein